MKTNNIYKMNKLINNNYKNKLPLFGQRSTVKIYTKIDSQRETNLKHNKNKSGIYKWINNQAGKFYIGSSVNLSKRLLFYLSYISMARHKGRSIIYSALLKYGDKNFTLEIIEYCDPKETIAREQYYINTLGPEYNILNIANTYHGFFFGKKHTEKSLALIKAAANNRIKLAVPGIEVEIFDV